MECREATARDHRLQPLIERRREQRIVPPQRMPDAADSIVIDFRQRFQQVDRAKVVPNRFHRTAGEVRSRRLEVIRVITERRIIGHEADKSQIGEFVGIMQVLQSAESRWFPFADSGRLVQTEHCGSLLREAVGNQQVSRYAVSWLGSEVNPGADVLLGLFPRHDLDVQGNTP